MERLLAETSVLKGVPLLPSDIANGMLFLASDMARCVNVGVNWEGAAPGCSWLLDLDLLLQLACRASLCCALVQQAAARAALI